MKINIIIIINLFSLSVAGGLQAPSPTTKPAVRGRVPGRPRGQTPVPRQHKALWHDVPPLYGRHPPHSPLQNFTGACSRFFSYRINCVFLGPCRIVILPDDRIPDSKKTRIPDIWHGLMNFFLNFISGCSPICFKINIWIRKIWINKYVIYYRKINDYIYLTSISIYMFLQLWTSINCFKYTSLSYDFPNLLSVCPS